MSPLGDMMSVSQPVKRAATVAVLLLVAWLLYRPALGGAFLLDDLPNLNGLSSVSDFGSALQYVLDGRAGPSGRPVSLASFALQAESWGGPARPFLEVNLLIHVLNGLLAYLFLFQLAKASRVNEANSHAVAVAALAVWILMPLLATSSLMVIQRMATLAALWMLAGLNAHLYFRGKLEDKPVHALTGMSVSLGITTTLAVLSKENGALLPTLVLVAEACLLPKPALQNTRQWAVWRGIFLALPTLAILAYLVSIVPYDPGNVAKRGFTAYERLITEARVLWDYLLNAVLPRPSTFTPFHGDYPVSRSILEPVTLLAVIGWAATIAAAIGLRRRAPLFTFAVAWYLAAHLLESTSVALYIYFEHRNYLAMLGPAFALSAWVLSLRGRYRTIGSLFLGIFVILNAIVLFWISSTWGQPRTAAHLWYAASPDSPGSLSFVVQEEIAAGNPGEAIDTIEQFVTANPEHAYLRLPQLTLYCRTMPNRDLSAAVESLKTELPHITYIWVVAAQLDQLYTAVRQNACTGIDAGAVEELARIVFSNERFQSVGHYVSLHHQLLAKIAFDRDDVDTALVELEAARDAGAALDIHFKIVAVLLASGSPEDAHRYLDEVGATLPRHPARRMATKAVIEELRHYVDQAAGAR